MADRKTALDVSSLTIAGTDWKDRAIEASLVGDVTNEDGKSLIDRYSEAAATKLKLTFSAEMFRGANLSRLSNLDVGVCTFGANAHIGELKSGTLSVDTKSQEGAGIKDKWSFPNSTGTDIELRGSMFVTTTALELATIAGGTLANLSVACTLTINSQSIVLTGLITNATLRSSRDSILEYDVTIKLRGSGSLAAAGQTILVDAITGDAIVTYSINMDGNTYSGNALITRASIDFSDGQLIRERFEFENQGTPTIA